MSTVVVLALGWLVVCCLGLLVLSVLGRAGAKADEDSVAWARQAALDRGLQVLPATTPDVGPRAACPSCATTVVAAPATACAACGSTLAPLPRIVAVPAEQRRQAG